MEQHRHCDILIRNSSLLTPEFEVRESVSVAIDGSYIVFIGNAGEAEEKYTAGETLDGRGKLLMPGFVDAHTHTCQQLLRGRLADEYPMIWTRFLVPFESTLTPDDVYWSAKLACLEMIKSGTTSFADSGGVHMHRAADAVVESGMRAAIARSTMDMGGEICSAMKESAEDAIAGTEELYRGCHGKGDGRVEIWFALRQVMTCSPELVRRTAEKAAEYNTGIHTHLCEHRDEVRFCLERYRKRPAEFLDEMGALGPNLLTAHNVVLSEHDITLLAERQVKAVHCPRANITNHGFPKTPRMLEAGVSIGLGCDGSGNTNSNLFDEMKTLRSATIAYWGLPVFDPVVLRCSELLKMATAGGSAALGHSALTGTVEVGKKADVILLNLEQPHLYPTQNIVSTIVESADGHDVTDSIIDGKIVMKNREVLTMDERESLAECARRMKEIVSRAGYDS
ncbi:MAG: amidohydrolase [Synergistaceae bacterium]|nr:amidohydrolase [Synergistaceae bacterium]